MVLRAAEIWAPIVAIEEVVAEVMAVVDSTLMVLPCVAAEDTVADPAEAEWGLVAVEATHHAVVMAREWDLVWDRVWDRVWDAVAVALLRRTLAWRIPLIGGRRWKDMTATALSKARAITNGAVAVTSPCQMSTPMVRSCPGPNLPLLCLRANRIREVAR